MSDSNFQGSANAVVRTLVKPRFYLDSVALMRMSASLAVLPGVEDAAMMMATPANREIMSNAGLLKHADIDAAPGDLLISVRGDDEAAAVDALQQAQTLLQQPPEKSASVGWRPRSLRAAMETLPDANLSLLSVPGAFATSEARKALRRGLHVMIFSDNVPVEEEVELKIEAQSLGRLVMGPDCGTAIINGVPLAFANHVPRGDIGIIGASGTGIQEVSCLLANAEMGVSHAIGVGGRDLGSDVGGISTLMAMGMLERDASTNHIVLISKPPAAAVTDIVLQRVAQSTKTFTVCFVGGSTPDLPSNASWAPTLSMAASSASEHSGGAKDGQKDRTRQYQLASNGESADAVFASLADARGNSPAANGKLLRGLFCGGTLCAEAQVLLLQAGQQVCSNAAIPGVVSGLPQVDPMHSIIDLGADEYTQGKPHPMIEPAIREPALCAALDDPATGVILLDCVIGNGAHADPAGQIVQSLERWRESSSQSSARSSHPPIVASVTGTEADPQIRSRQMSILQAAGINTAISNASATLDALLLLAEG